MKTQGTRCAEGLPLCEMGPVQEVLLNMLKKFKAFAGDESGVTAIEYGLIAGLIAVVIIAVITTVGTDLTNLFNNVSGGLQNASGN
jgi:pilus assembly protein Flp/PilA